MTGARRAGLADDTTTGASLLQAAGRDDLRVLAGGPADLAAELERS